MIFNTAQSTTDEQIARLVNAVNENMAELRTEVQTEIAELQRAIAGATFNAVKSVQRGIIPAGTVTRLAENIRVTTSEVNYTMANYIDVNIQGVSSLNKCLVITDRFNGNGDELARLINSTTLRVYVKATNISGYDTQVATAISWQVIEFY